MITAEENVSLENVYLHSAGRYHDAMYLPSTNKLVSTDQPAN